MIPLESKCDIDPVLESEISQAILEPLQRKKGSFSQVYLSSKYALKQQTKPDFSCGNREAVSVLDNLKWEIYVGSVAKEIGLNAAESYGIYRPSPQLVARGIEPDPMLVLSKFNLLPIEYLPEKKRETSRKRFWELRKKASDEGVFIRDSFVGFGSADGVSPPRFYGKNCGWDIDKDDLAMYDFTRWVISPNGKIH